jgi:hypothetical protein
MFITGFKNLSELIANQVVEGFISGMHKSPFHGFCEFAEHKIYNQANQPNTLIGNYLQKTDRLYTERFEEETTHLLSFNYRQFFHAFSRTNKYTKILYESKLCFFRFSICRINEFAKKTA